MNQLTSTGDGLAVTLVLHITASKHTLAACHAGTRNSGDVTILIDVNLALDQSSGGVVTDGIEETVGINNFLLASDGVLDAEVGHQTVLLLLTENLGSDRVEADRDLGVGQETVGHGLGGTELVTANKHGDARAVLGQEHGLFSGRITTTNNVEGLVAEDGNSAIAHSASTNTVLPVNLFTRQVEAAGIGTGGNDNSIGGASRLVVGTVIPFRPELERPLRQIDPRDCLRDHFGSESDRLFAHGIHELRSVNAVRETGEVLDIGGGSKLATCGGAVGQHTLIEDGLELCTRQVDRGGVSGGARTDDCERLVNLLLQPQLQM